MRKPLVIVALLAGYAILLAYGPSLPLAGGRPTEVAVFLMVTLPIACVVWLFIMFCRWHRKFHRRMQRDGIRWDRSVGEEQ